MKSIGIIGAMNLEVQLISARIEDAVSDTWAMFRFMAGTIGAVNVVTAVCGTGKVNAAACTQAMIDRFNVDCVINTGIAGAICDTLNPLDIVISSDVTHHDVRPAQMRNLFPFTNFFTGNSDLIRLAQKACADLDLPGKYVTGRVVSGESFINDDAEKIRIRDSYQACCVEMEGAAIGHVAYLNSIPFVIIRTISDRADSKAAICYEEFEALAADNSAGIVLSMLKNLARATNSYECSPGLSCQASEPGRTR